MTVTGTQVREFDSHSQPRRISSARCAVIHAEARRGFTLVEVLIVVVILGILASTVVPRFSTTDAEARETAMLRDLRSLRGQIELYRLEHDGRYPGQTPDGTAGSAQDFLDALLLSSDRDGQTGPVGTLPLGPYIMGQMPPNSFTGARGVRIVPDVSAAVPDDSPTEGWFYDPVTGQLKANTTALSSEGWPLHEL